VAFYAIALGIGRCHSALGGDRTRLDTARVSKRGARPAVPPGLPGRSARMHLHAKVTPACFSHPAGKGSASKRPPSREPGAAGSHTTVLRATITFPRTVYGTQFDLSAISLSPGTGTLSAPRALSVGRTFAATLASGAASTLAASASYTLSSHANAGVTSSAWSNTQSFSVNFSLSRDGGAALLHDIRTTFDFRERNPPRHAQRVHSLALAAGGGGRRTPARRGDGGWPLVPAAGALGGPCVPLVAYLLPASAAGARHAPRTAAGSPLPALHMVPLPSCRSRQ
jgi:hypothetical protein